MTIIIHIMLFFQTQNALQGMQNDMEMIVANNDWDQVAMEMEEEAPTSGAVLSDSMVEDLETLLQDAAGGGGDVAELDLVVHSVPPDGAAVKVQVSELRQDHEEIKAAFGFSALNNITGMVINNPNNNVSNKTFKLPLSSCNLCDNRT